LAAFPAGSRRVHLKRCRAYASGAAQRGRLLSLLVVLATVAFNSAAAQDDASYAEHNAPRVTSVDFEGAELFTRQ
jgi:hypothetical protein